MNQTNQVRYCNYSLDNSFAVHSCNEALKIYSTSTGSYCRAAQFMLLQVNNALLYLVMVLYTDGKLWFKNVNYFDDHNNLVLNNCR